MNLIKLALSEDDLQAKAFEKVTRGKTAEDLEDFATLKASNQKAKKLQDRYTKFAKYKKNKNIKKGLIAAAIVSGLASGGYLYNKHKEKK